MSLENFTSAEDQIKKLGIIKNVPGSRVLSDTEAGFAELKPEPVNFGEKAQAIVDGLNDDQTAPADTMKGFAALIETAAKAGELKGSKGNVYSVEDIKAQLLEFEEVMSGRMKINHDPMLFIPSANGLREAVRLLSTNQRTSDTFREALSGFGLPEQLEQLPQGVSVARDMGGLALEAAKSHPETEREMLDRHVREYQTELSELYKELRSVGPGSNEALQLEKRIRETKEDIGRVDKKRRNLAG